VNVSEIRLKAIPYYVCFIIRMMRIPGTTLTFDEIQEASRIGEPYDDNFLLADSTVLAGAIEFLEEEYIVEVVTDEFAPAIIIQHDNFATNMDLLLRRPESVFRKYALAGAGQIAWLNKALGNIGIQLTNAQSDASAIIEIDERNDQSSNEDLWEPIPLDRSDEQQRKAVEALDRIFEELRGDNGYASTNPEEKAFVQDKLSAVSKRLRDDVHISWMYLADFAFKPLGIVIKRFGSAAVGVAATAAREALISWLKSKGISFLDDLLK
jgi:hypothetical protein